MFENTATPRARHWAGPLFLALVSGMSLPFIKDAWLVVVVGSLTIVFGAWALVNGLHHVGRIFIEMKNETRELDWKFTDSYTMTILSQMNESQIKAYRAGHHIIDKYVSTKGYPVDKIGGCEAYLYLAWYMLVNSSDYKVMPINRFKPETYHFDMFGDHAVDDYQQARNFTIWLDHNGYATWSIGNDSATWKKGITPDLVMSHLGIDRKTYAEETETEE